MYERDITEEEKQQFREEFIQMYGCYLSSDEVMNYLHQQISTLKISDTKDVIITDEKYSWDVYTIIKNEASPQFLEQKLNPRPRQLHIERECLKAVIEYEITVDSFIAFNTTITFYVSPKHFQGEFQYECCFIANDTMQYDEDRGLIISLDGNEYFEVPIRRSCKKSKN